jgi:hypothetical protein
VKDVERRIRDNISELLLDPDLESKVGIDILTWLRSTSSEIGDFTYDTIKKLAERSLTAKDDYFKITLISYILLDIDTIDKQLIESYFDALRSVDTDFLDIEMVSQSISIMLSREAIDKELLVIYLNSLNFEFSTRLISNFDLSDFFDSTNIPSELLEAANYEKRLEYRVGVFWHFLFIVKPILLKLIPTNRAYKNLLNAINDWPYSSDNNANYLLENVIVSIEEKLLFEEFGSKLRLLMSKTDDDNFEEMPEYNELCKEYYNKLFQGIDIFDKIYFNLPVSANKL